MLLLHKLVGVAFQKSTGNSWEHPKAVIESVPQQFQTCDV